MARRRAGRPQPRATRSRRRRRAALVDSHTPRAKGAKFRGGPIDLTRGVGMRPECRAELIEGSWSRSSGRPRLGRSKPRRARLPRHTVSRPSPFAQRVPALRGPRAEPDFASIVRTDRAAAGPVWCKRSSTALTRSALRGVRPRKAVGRYHRGARSASARSNAEGAPRLKILRCRHGAGGLSDQSGLDIAADPRRPDTQTQSITTPGDVGNDGRQY